MSLFLIELALSTPSAEAARNAIEQVGNTASVAGGELIESQVTADYSQVFVIVEGDTCRGIDVATLGAAVEASVDGPHEVRLVGADLADIKAARPSGSHLVEWDIPAEITMEQYLTRKAEKSPLYDQVPDVDFLRTYVREDTAKCLCFYDAETEEQVRHAREVVSTPVSRLHELAAE